MRRRIFALVLALMMCVAFLAACGGDTSSTPASTPAASTGDTSTPDTSTPDAPDGGPKYGGTYATAIQKEPVTTNPNGNEDNAGLGVSGTIFNKLVVLDNLSQVVNDLAESYDISEDGLTYTFNLYQNVNFHNGEKMTADDVKFTFEEIIAQEGRSSYMLGAVDSFEAPDDYTFVINMKEVDASLLYNLAYGGFYVLPRSVYEGKDWTGADAMMDPVGTGAFKFESWEKGSNIKLVRNDDYFVEGLPYLDAIVFAIVDDTTTQQTALMAGEYDAAGFADYTTLAADPNLTLDTAVYASRFVVLFNMAKAPFDDLKVRQAICHGINMDEMLALGLKEKGLLAEHFIGPLFEWAVNEDVKTPTYDADKAKSLLEEAGATDLSVTLTTLNYSPFPEVAEVFKSQMAEIGIAVEIQMLEYAAYDDKVTVNKDYDIAITSDYQGPEIAAIGTTVGTDAYRNCMGYSNAEVDDLLAEGVTYATFEQRAPIYERIQEILAEDLPFFPMSEWVGYYPHQSYVKNAPSSPEMAGVCSHSNYAYVWLDK